MALTGKQQRFIEEYLVDRNATQAAIRAGYKPENARKTASENLTKPDIKAEIEKRSKKAAEAAGITRDRVLQELAKLAFHDPRKLYNDQGNLLPVPELDDDTAAAISAVDVVVESSEGNELSVTKKVKLSDKKGALALAMKYLGMDQSEEMAKLDAELRRLQIEKARVELDAVKREAQSGDLDTPHQEYILAPDDELPENPIL